MVVFKGSTTAMAGMSNAAIGSKDEIILFERKSSFNVKRKL